MRSAAAAAAVLLAGGCGGSAGPVGEMRSGLVPDRFRGSVAVNRSPAISGGHPKTLRAVARQLRDGAEFQAVRRVDPTHALVRRRAGGLLPVFVVDG